MTTALAIIESAIALIGSIPDSQSSSPDLIERGRLLYNDVISEWGATNVYIPYQTYLEFDLTVGKEKYTVGLGGSYDFNSAPIIDIMEVNFVLPAQPAVRYYGRLITEKMYSTIVFTNPLGIPSWVMLRNNESGLFSELFFQVVPSEAVTAQLLCKQRLSEIGVTELSVVLGNIPPNAKRALKYAIATDLFFTMAFPFPPGFEDKANKAIESYLSANLIDPYVQKDELIRDSRWYGNWRGYY